MSQQETGLSRQHVLLVGIDAYEHVDPLRGCARDADAMEALFVDRLGVPVSAIKTRGAAGVSR